METILFPIADTLFSTGSGGSVTGLTGTGAAAATALSTGASVAAASKTPKVKGPATMPTRDSDAVRQAMMRQTQQMQARGGRASTIFTDDKLGG